MTTPGGQTAITLEQYKKHTPFSQGYLSYMQSEWNDCVPKTNPYFKGTAEAEAWDTGSLQAILDVQDGEE